MRIPIWPGTRLSVWEKQNLEAVRIRLPYAQPRTPVRRVLSMPGWMLLLIRYDWRDRSGSNAEDPAKSFVVQQLTRELHRRATHLQTIRSASEDDVPTDAWVMVTGEVQGLRGALGIALGGKVADGNADEMAQEHYRSWAVEQASEWNRCRCELCLSAFAGQGR